ncbi:MAG: hypothetical protein QOI31_1664 [Solirubrobacterales bacterium]|jgi:hypothetical protein|nr:hypothetical protein [Solirubrobacterales bacterium]
MRIAKWMLALMALLACGLIAVGCGDDDDDSSSSDEPATEESSSSDDSSSDSSSSGVDADAFLSECEDAFAGTPGEDAAATACQQAADALEQCGDQAEAAGGDDSAVEAAVQICQDAADEAVKQLEAANP